MTREPDTNAGSSWVSGYGFQAHRTSRFVRLSQASDLLARDLETVVYLGSPISSLPPAVLRTPCLIIK